MCWCPGAGQLSAGSRAAGGCWCLAAREEAAAGGGWARWLAKAPALLDLLAISQAAINAADSSEKRGLMTLIRHLFRSTRERTIIDFFFFFKCPTINCLVSVPPVCLCRGCVHTFTPRCHTWPRGHWGEKVHGGLVSPQTLPWRDVVPEAMGKSKAWLMGANLGAMRGGRERAREACQALLWLAVQGHLGWLLAGGHEGGGPCPAPSSGCCRHSRTSRRRFCLPCCPSERWPCRGLTVAEPRPVAFPPAAP